MEEGRAASQQHGAKQKAARELLPLCQASIGFLHHVPASQEFPVMDKTLRVFIPAAGGRAWAGAILTLRLAGRAKR